MRRIVGLIIFIVFVFAVSAASSAVAGLLSEAPSAVTTTITTTTGHLPPCVGTPSVDPLDEVGSLPAGQLVRIPIVINSTLGGVFDMVVDDGGAGGTIFCLSPGCIAFPVPIGATPKPIDYQVPDPAPPTITITATLHPHSWACGPGSSGGTSSKTYLTDDLSDFDIASFRVSKKASVSKKKSVVKIELGVENQAQETSPRPATVQGMQNQVEVYNETVDVSDEPGKRATTFRFPDYRPLATGTIDWTATILDGDPDQDVATAVTKVTP